MGGKDSKIILDQVCSSTFDQNYTLPGFCTLRGSHNGTRDTFCKKIGKNSKEWHSLGKVEDVNMMIATKQINSINANQVADVVR